MRYTKITNVSFFQFYLNNTVIEFEQTNTKRWFVIMSWFFLVLKIVFCYMFFYTQIEKNHFKKQENHKQIKILLLFCFLFIFFFSFLIEGMFVNLYFGILFFFINLVVFYVVTLILRENDVNTAHEMRTALICVAIFSSIFVISYISNFIFTNKTYQFLVSVFLIFVPLLVAGTLRVYYKQKWL